MSITVDYFFNFDGTLAELALKVNAVLGCSLAPYEGSSGDRFDRFLSMELSLGTRTMENDGVLDFEDYEFEIGIRNPAPDGDLRELVPSAMLLVSTLLQRRCDITAGMLVYDCQVLLARYIEKQYAGKSGIYDEVGQKLVSFPEHITDIYSRIPRLWQ
jgi:hypothetical protein